MKHIIFFLALIFASSGALAANCDKNPTHPDCQEPPPPPDDGKLKVYDAGGQVVGELISIENYSRMGTVRYEFNYQGQLEVTGIHFSQQSLGTENAATPDYGYYYKDAGCQGTLLASANFINNASLFQPPIISVVGDDNSYGKAASWIAVATGVIETNVQVLGTRTPSAGPEGPAGTCRPVNFIMGTAYQLEFITDLYQTYAPPFEVK